VRWVDNKDYLGLDRRKRRPSLRPGERRMEDSTRAAPTLAAFFRQLRVRAQSVNTPAGAAAFAKRARAIGEYALTLGEGQMAAALTSLAAEVERRPDDDWREKLERDLAWLAARLAL
jgi:hypothetical protein